MYLTIWLALSHLSRRRYCASMSLSSRTWPKVAAEKWGSCQELSLKTSSQSLVETFIALHSCSTWTPRKTLSPPSRARTLATQPLKRTSGGFHSWWSLWTREVNSSPVRRTLPILMSSLSPCAPPRLTRLGSSSSSWVNQAPTISWRLLGWRCNLY